MIIKSHISAFGRSASHKISIDEQEEPQITYFSFNAFSSPTLCSCILCGSTIIGLVKPLMGALDRDDTAAVIRVSVMIFTSALAMITFVRSFIEARKNRGKE